MEGLSSVKVDEDDPETGWRAWVGPLHRELAEEERIRPYHHKLKHFGKGGFAEVDLVVHLRSGRLTAVKTMDVRKNHDLAQLAYKEADNIAKFITSHNEHDNIVDFYGMDRLEQEGQLRIYMSPANSNLRDLMEPFGQVKQALDAQTLQAVTDQILQALIYLHGVIGLIHRDVKPDNILVKNLSEGHPDVIVFQLADFGLSKEVRRAGKTECGTYLYWAPEVMQLAYANERIENDLFRSPDEPKDNHRPRTQTPTMDVWAFGVTLLEAALSGPFCGYLDLRSTALVRRWPSLLRQRSRGTPVEHIFVDNPGKRPRADQLVGTIVWENLTSIIRGRLDTQTVSDHVTGKIGEQSLLTLGCRTHLHSAR